MTIQAADADASAAPVVEKKAAPAKKKKAKEPEGPFVPPILDPNTPSPIFRGNTGGLLRKARVEEFYVLTWTTKKEAQFEMPSGGLAIMRKGPNLLKLPRKEHCMTLLTQLRTKFKCDGCIYRVYPDGEVEYLHPKDGIYPEKVGPNRVAQNVNYRRIGENLDFADMAFGEYADELGPQCLPYGINDNPVKIKAENEALTRLIEELDMYEEADGKVFKYTDKAKSMLKEKDKEEAAKTAA